MINNVSRLTEASVYTPSDTRKPQPVYALSFEQLGGEDVMPIGGWWAPYHPKDPVADLTTREIYDAIRESGVRILTVSCDDYAYHPEYVMDDLERTRESGLYMFVHDSKVKEITDGKAFAERISAYVHHPVCVGVHILDEPVPGGFRQINDAYHAFEQSGVKDTLLYSNMFPSSYEGFRDDPVLYEAYLEEYLSSTATKFLSADYYPFSYVDEGTHCTHGLSVTMAVSEKCAQKYHIPNWVFLQAGGQWANAGKPSMKYFPNREEMNWNLHFCLAYGAKSIQYFTLLQPEEFSATDAGIDCQRIGLIGFDGKKTMWYDIVKEQNRWVAMVDEVLMHASHMGVIPVGTALDEKICKVGKIREFRELIGAEGDNTLIGCFDYQGRTMLYVASQAAEETGTIKLHFDANAPEIEAPQTRLVPGSVTLHFDAVRAFTYYDRTGKHDYCGKDPIINLGAGDGVILVLK